MCYPCPRTVLLPLSPDRTGQWLTPWWEEEGGKWVDKGPKVRAGFVAKTRINRHDFGVSWNDVVDKGGVVVGNTIEITIDAEAILEGQDDGAREATLDAGGSAA